MANITKRGNAYRITVCAGYDHNRNKYNIQTATFHPTAKTPKAIEKEVNDFAREFEKRVMEGNYLSGDKMTFSHFVGIWDKEWAYQNVSARTREAYEDELRVHIIPRIGHYAIGKIKSLHIQAIITDMIDKGYSVSKIRKVFHVCHSVLKYAYQMEVIESDPCLRCSLPKEKKDRDIHCFDVAQTKRFLDVVVNGYTVTYRAHTRIIKETGEKRTIPKYTETRHLPLQLQAYYMLAVYGGFRRGEMIALTWEDINFDKRTVNINKATTRLRSGEQILKEPKTESGYREIMLPASCFDYLKKWKGEQIQLSYQLGTKWEGYRGPAFDKNFVFIQTDSGKMMNLTTPYTKFKEIISHVKNPDGSLYFPQITLHELRHSSATLLIANGTDIETVSHRLGHSRASVTLDIYGHALKDMDDKASKVLEDCLG